MSRFCINRFRETQPRWTSDLWVLFDADDVEPVHRSIPGYEPTPLIPRPDLACRFGLGRVLIKDESRRFGLNAFKVLGASYAVCRLLCRQLAGERGATVSPGAFYRSQEWLEPLRFTFCTATDGNHGRGLAWVARRLGQRAVIFIPRGSALSRIGAIRAEGAEVIEIDGSYDETVAAAAVRAEREGWLIVSDTAWPGYSEVPRWIMAGYLTIFREINTQIGSPLLPDAVFVQAGVGALAATAAWYYNQPLHAGRTRLVSVEPSSADCLLASAVSPDGSPTASSGVPDSIMAGLNCGLPSLEAWPLIRVGFDLFLAIPDEYSLQAMRTLYHPGGRAPRITSGESGAAGLAGLIALYEDALLAKACASLDLKSDATVLLINTEGATNPAFFRRVVAGDAT